MAVHQNKIQIPDTEAVESALRSAVAQQGCDLDIVEIVERQPSVYASTYPLEILTCKFSDGKERKIICKRQVKHRPASGHGHRGGVAYEATIYREILQHAQVPTPQFIGAYSDVRTQEIWLFLEYLEDSNHLNKLDVQQGLLSAARWLGQFHAANEKRVPSKEYYFLSRYDAEYYAGWTARTLEYTHSSQEQFPWLQSVCNEFMKLIELLLSEPLTVIHSEFYPRNILVSNGNVYPVDWESAAIAAGEIDLACLTEGWGSDVVRECESTYQRARWPSGSPDAFSVKLDVARMYQEFRWLGDREQWQEWGSRRIERIGRLARGLGLL
jgi:thiamine kinase-like enzyme